MKKIQIRQNRQSSIVNSILVLFLIFNIIFVHSNFCFFSVKGSSEWYHDSYSDFKNGTLEQLVITNFDANFEINLKLKSVDLWTNNSPSNHPSARAGFDMVTIFNTKEILLFGGDDGNDKLADTWIYNYSSNKWKEQTMIDKPVKRNWHAMAAIYNTDKVLLFGGGLYKNDTWIYDHSLGTWTLVTPKNSPGGRIVHAMASIYNTDKILLFGGDNFGDLNDAWIYDLSDNNWTELDPNGDKPSGRHWHKMATIWGTDKVLLFGGSTGPALDDTWTYDLGDNKWTNMNPQIKPKGRYLHAMTMINGDDKVVLFGGRAGNNANDIYIYDLSDNIWTYRNVIIKPKVRCNHAIATDYFHKSIILFGGQDLETYYSDTWTYNAYEYYNDGFFTSKQYSLGHSSAFKTIEWDVFTPRFTSINIQLRSALKETELLTKEFVGPDGNKIKSYTNSPANIWTGHNGDKWLQIKVHFNTADEHITPKLKNLKIKYNILPRADQLNPRNNSIILNNSRLFEWNFIDPDSEIQTGFQVLIDNNSEFGSIDFDSGEQSSENKFWNFPMETNNIRIPNGSWYWKVRVRDNDSDWGFFSEPWRVEIKTEPPKSNIYYPVNNGSYYELKAINGTAVNPNSDSEIIKIEVIIKRINDGLYWDGFGWIEKEIWLLTEGKAEWYYNLNTITWSSNHQYLVQSRAVDNYNNIENPSDENYFLIDMNEPNSFITSLENITWINELNIIEGKIFDTGGSGIESVNIQIQQIDNNFFWNGIIWDTNEYWFTISAEENWEFSTNNITWIEGKEYSIRSQAIDIAGNSEEDIKNYNFIFDSYSPMNLSIKADDENGFLRSQITTISLNAEDNISGVTEMAFSFNETYWTDWEPFMVEKTITFSRDNGEKNVYFRVRDHANNTAEKMKTLILDSEKPYYLKITINEGKSKTESNKVILSLNAIDDTSGVYQMSFSTDKKIWTPWENFSNVRSFELSKEKGTKVIYFKVKDHAGNIADPVSSSIRLIEKEDSIDRNSLIVISILLIIIILISTVIISYRKKKIKHKILSTGHVTVKPTIIKQTPLRQNQPVINGSPQQPSDSNSNQSPYQHQFQTANNELVTKDIQNRSLPPDQSHIGYNRPILPPKQNS